MAGPPIDLSALTGFRYTTSLLTRASFLPFATNLLESNYQTRTWSRSKLAFQLVTTLLLNLGHHIHQSFSFYDLALALVISSSFVCLHVRAPCFDTYSTDFEFRVFGGLFLPNVEVVLRGWRGLLGDNSSAGTITRPTIITNGPCMSLDEDVSRTALCYNPCRNRNNRTTCFC